MYIAAVETDVVYLLPGLPRLFSRGSSSPKVAIAAAEIITYRITVTPAVIRVIRDAQ